ncbi:hypothetical protein [Gluconobacter thailandicus]|uniref:Uncharacterized protein n=1 Tax=Gluconobacter thailandicus TaxID=257438 RepID=A0AAP9EW68_GLUTH|nr:hypothetical protein [Gluconobacter thailandicus]QEH97867.1 hypothetical protein FXF46_16395 [Gluconobacter thailandicus]
MSEKPAPSKSPRTPVAAVKAGRGNLGGSTAEAALAERAIMQGRSPLLADGDARNPGLSAFRSVYERFGLNRPVSEEAAVLKEWFSEAFGMAAEQKKSLLVDVGGGDRTLELWAKEEGIISLAESIGLEVTGLFMCGPQVGDLDYIKRLWESELFRPKKALLVFNDWSVPVGHDPDRAFGKLTENPFFTQMSDCKLGFLRIPKLSILPAIIESGLSFQQVMESAPRPCGTPFDVLRRAQVKRWFDLIESNIVAEKVESWLP